MTTPTIDKRVNSEVETVEEISSENMVSEGHTDNVDGAPPLVVLSPAELALRDAEAAGTATPEEVEAALANGKKLQEEAEAAEAALKQTLNDVGPCLLIRFEHGNSLTYAITPGMPVSDNAILAACRDLVFKIETARARELWYDWDEREAEMEALQERLALPGMNRKERRAKRFAGRK